MKMPLVVVLISFVLSLQAQTKAVVLGQQVWASKNLEVDRFRDGTQIEHAITFKDWQVAGEAKKPAWCYYKNDPVNGQKYGKLYNWYAVMDPRGLCPQGFHSPSDSEWTTLIDFLGGRDVAGTKLKSASGWLNDGNGSNESNMEGLPGGFRNSKGDYEFLGELAVWWT